MSQAPRREAAQAVVETASVERPQLSPDGRWVLYSQRQASVADNVHVYSLWIAATSAETGARRVYECDPTSELFRVVEAEWAPDSSRIAFLVPSGIAVVQVESSDRPEQYDAPSNGELSALSWSPDGASVAFIHQPPAEKRHFDAAVPIDLERVFFRNVVENTVLDSQFDPPAAEVWALDLRSGSSERVAEMPPRTRGLHWVDGKPRPGQEPGTPQGLVDPSGRWLARPAGADWFCPPTVTELGEGDRTSGGTPSQGDPLRKSRMTWAQDGQLLFAEGWHMERHLFRMKPIGEPERITPEGYTYGGFSAQAGCVAFVRENVVEPANLFVISEDELLGGRDLEAKRLTHVDSPFTPAPRVSRLSWASEDGRSIDGYLVLPPEGQGEAPYPLLVEIQGGPTMVHMGQWSHFPNALFATQGYAVFVPNTRGRFGGYDKDFCHHNEISGFQLRDPLIDLLTGVDVLVRDGIADPDRMGVMGHSYGAVLTAYAITQTNRFRAASFHEGMVDQIRLIRLYGGSPAGLAGMKHITGYGSPYDRDEIARIMQESPIDNMSGVATPTLVEAGEESLAYDALLLAHGLAHHGVPFELNIDPRTKHVVFEPKLFVDSIVRNLDWFDYWLRDADYPNADRQREFDEWKRRTAKEKVG